jgi:inosose dehydratase
VERRHFIQSIAGAAVLPAVSFTPKEEGLPISCNQYSWITFYGREGRDWGVDPDVSLKEFASTGIKAYEPAFNHAGEVAPLLPFLRKYQLVMPSVYVNSALHNKDEAQKSIESVLAIADALKAVNTKIIVTNPNPITWGSEKYKTDEELIEQAKNMDKLGAELRKRGMKLAYHTHDVELRAAAREFHHTLQATNPENVSLCLDVHWIYRGSGNSQVALFDIVKMYGKRIAELHIRQSKNGIWQESFGDGDIDYPRLVTSLDDIKVRPHLVLEQCLEKQSPNTMNSVAAHKADLAAVQQVFGKWVNG